MGDQLPNGDERTGLDVIGALSEPTRRALYDHIAEAGRWVGRDDAADAVGVERGTAAHHLDRLASDGLLEVDYQRLSGRSGPGAGRPAKVYRRARRDIRVSLPPRDYKLAGRLLAEAVHRSQSEGIDVITALEQVAGEQGQTLADEIRSVLAGASSEAAERQALLDALSAEGFEPCHDADGTIVLRNCPFHQLAQEHTDLICRMNLCMLKATVQDLGGLRLRADLEPEEGICCVKLRPDG